MDKATSRLENRPQQRKTVRFACDEAEVDDRAPSLGPFLSFDIPATSGTTTPQGPEKAVEPSLQMVPYVPREFGQDSTAMVENHGKHPLFNLLSNQHHNPQLLRASYVPRPVLVSEASPSRGAGLSGGPKLELGPVLPLVSFQCSFRTILCMPAANYVHSLYSHTPRLSSRSSTLR